jgi:hypothetical protein
VPEGHSFACEGEAAVDGVSETRSHAVGQSLDKRTLLRGGRGHPVGLYAPLHLAGLSRDTSINRATAVGRESPEPTPAFNITLTAWSMPFDIHRLIPSAWIAGRAGPIGGCYVSSLCDAVQLLGKM